MSAAPDPRVEAIEGLETELRAMVRQVKKVTAERAAEVHPDLQPASYFILGWLAENGPARGSALACEFSIDKGAISRHVQHLVDVGLVERAPDPEDGRAHLIALTPRAAELLAVASGERRRAWNAVLAEWSVDDLQTLATLLGRLNGALH